MKKHYFDTNLSLKQLIFNMSSEIYSISISDIENVYFEHKTRKDVVVKPIKVEISNQELKSIHDHFLFTNHTLVIEGIEDVIYDYVVSFVSIDEESNQENANQQCKINILNTSLTELMCLPEKSEFSEDDKNWSIFEYVSDIFEPNIIKEVENMDLSI